MTDTEREALTRRIDELCAENERLRQENQSIGMAAYEVGYKNGSVHYELEHCSACKNVADLQEALDENAKLRELVRDMWREGAFEAGANYVTEAYALEERTRELGIEVS